MTRAELTLEIRDARRRLGRSCTEIAEAIGRDRVWSTAACLGQHPFDAESAGRLVDTLQLAGETGRSEGEIVACRCTARRSRSSSTRTSATAS